MKIPYRTPDEYLPVDISKLRPKDSYKHLLSKRTHNLDDLIKKHGKIPENLLTNRLCPICGHNETNPFIKKDYLTIVKCSRCDFVFTNPVFNEEHYRKTYQSEDYQQYMKKLAEDSHDYRKERFGKERVSTMKRFINKGNNSYLDVGCSTGFVVEAAKEAGWDAMGVDLNPSAVRFGLNRGLNIFEGHLSHEQLKQKKFDIVSLFDVLEHVPYPKKEMELVKDKLKDNGIVFLYLPNFDSADRILMGEKAHFIRPSHHLNYFTPRTIVSFLNSLKMKIEYLVTEGLDLANYIRHQEEVEGKKMDVLKEIHDKLQFFINAGCYGQNLRVIARK